MAVSHLTVRLDGQNYFVAVVELRAYLQLALLRNAAPPTPAWMPLTSDGYEKQPADTRVDLGPFNQERWRLLEAMLGRTGGLGERAPPRPATAAAVPPVRLTVWYFHGKHGSPTGEKAQALQRRATEFGLDFDAPDFRGEENPDARVATVLARPPVNGPLILVGSSMGGYVAAMTAQQLQARGMLLLAPAFFRPGYRVGEPTPPALPTHVIHAWNDDVVPVAGTLRWCQPRRAELHLVEGTHQLHEHLTLVEQVFGRLVFAVRAALAAATNPELPS